MINVVVTYLAMVLGLVPLTRAAASWTMPPIFSGFLVTGSISGAILQVVLIILDILLYLPFVLAIEKRFKAQEISETSVTVNETDKEVSIKG